LVVLCPIFVKQELRKLFHDGVNVLLLDLIVD
jgi:hypothetical protein